MKMKLKFLAMMIFSFLIAVGCSSKVKNDSKQSYEVAPQNDTLFCYIKSVDTQGKFYEIKFDSIDFLHSEEAQKAMIEDGLLKPGEWPLNDYYIRNKEQTIETRWFDESVKILMQTYSFNEVEEDFNWNQQITIKEFLHILTREEGVNYINHPFNIILSGDKVIQIKEQYIP
jgi:hypothetical protein